jgi:hypothetical protein
MDPAAWRRVSPAPESAQRFKILLFESGGGVLGCGRRRQQVIAPSMLCLNEREQPTLDPAPSGVRAQAVYFHPRVIHDDFTLEAAYAQSGQPHWQDQKWLQPFVVRGEGCPDLIHLGPGPAARLSGLFSALGSDLYRRSDSGWRAAAVHTFSKFSS